MSAMGIAHSNVGDSPSSVNVDHLPFYNPHITELEIKPAPILAHEHGAGAPCRVCGSACPGLDLHFWRKICKACRCRKEDHDVPSGGLDPGQLRIGKLFGSALAEQLKGLHLNGQAGKEPSNPGYRPHELQTDVKGKAEAFQKAAVAHSSLSSNGHSPPKTGASDNKYTWLPTDRSGLPIRDPALVSSGVFMPMRSL